MAEAVAVSIDKAPSPEQFISSNSVAEPVSETTENAVSDNIGFVVEEEPAGEPN